MCQNMFINVVSKSVVGEPVRHGHASYRAGSFAQQPQQSHSENAYSNKSKNLPTLILHF